ncbi:MAG: gliding motility-associated ABC transporter ATP-binding subunit GldA [Bacteroidales bacterium]|nr:gliding motility-associated ABC transporter ATP-binding subunit GldA [Bacteroidales bacterium]
MSIVVKNITKIYDKQKVLDNISFQIKTGEIVGFLGPNGAGKSTMMKIITCYIPQTSGDVFVNDLDIIENSLEIRKNIGYLPENNPLYPDMYVKEYLEFVFGIYYPRKNSKKKIVEIIEKTGLIVESKKKIGALSKGFRQRVGLAQALIHEPKILILDEPTSGLDPNQIVEIRNLIKNLGKEKTVLLSTHIMQEVEAICNRIIIINDGVIVADDTTKNIHDKSKEKFQTVIVEFNLNCEEKKLKEIKGVKKILKLSENNWLIQSNKDNDIRGDIFDFAVKNNLTVLSLQKKEKNLEEVFRELTK